MEFLEQIKEMIEVFDPNIFDSKVIDNEAELNGAPFVAPEARGGINFIVPLDKEVRSKEIVSQDAGLGKAIAALTNFEVDPTVAVLTRKLVPYSSMNSNGMSEILMRTYSGLGIGVSR
jgi:hypothetical protein